MHKNDLNAIKTSATKALGSLGGETATTALIDMLDDGEFGVSLHAVRGLVNIGTDRAYDALPKFVSRQRDEMTERREATALKEARAALERRNARNESAPQDEPTPQITDAPPPEPPPPATTNETTQANQDTPPAQPEKTSSNKPILWLAVIAFLAILVGVAVWRKK